MSRIRRHWATLITTAVAASGVGLVAPGAAHAAGTWVIDVTTRADDGSPTSLRGAIDQANATPGSWLIRLQPGDPYVLDRACQQGDPDDNHGGDLDITTTDDVTISAEPGTATIAVGCVGERVLDHAGGGTGTLRLHGIGLTGGNLPDGEPGDQGGNRNGHAAAGGGALRSTGKAVILTGSRVHDNRTGNGGVGAPALFAGVGGNGGTGGSGSAIHAARVELHATIVEHNFTGRGGRGANGVGVGNDGGTGGTGGTGAIMAGEVELDRAVVRENFSGAGGDGGDALGVGGKGGDGGDGGAAGGIYTPTLSMVMATLAGNGSGLGGSGGDGKGASGGHGGDGGAGGGGFVGTAEVVRSTIHGNVANRSGRTGDGVGLVAAPSHGRGGGLIASSPIELRWSTVTSNRAEAGAANLHVPAGSTRLATIIGDARWGGTDCSTPVLSLGHNVTQTPSCGLDAGDLAVADVNTVLGPLADNGGATPTRLPLLAGGLADLIPAADCIALLDAHWDQRQEARPYGDCEPGAVELPPTGSSRFVPLPPTRAFDTREPGLHAGYVGAGETRTIPLAGVAGVPAAGVTAVAINLTVDHSGGPGFFTAWPAGSEQPLASSINTVRAGQTLPNLVIVPLGVDGAVSFYAQTGGHLLADVVGYFEPAGVARGGRIVPIRPTRLFDTRSTDGPGPSGKLAAGGEHWITVPGEAGVPQEHVAAVVLNLTGTEATGAGYVTLYPDGQARPLASSLNLGGPGATAANLTIVPLGELGRIRMFSQSGTHLVGDVTGYITDDTAPAASAGLMVPLAPARVFDTRGDVEPSGFVGPGATIDPRVAGVAGIPPFAAAALLNVTATGAAGAGYVTGWPAGTDRPVASTLNVAGPGETRANAAILPIGAAGRIAFFSQSGTHLLADAAGYLLPDPQSGLLGP